MNNRKSIRRLAYVLVLILLVASSIGYFYGYRLTREGLAKPGSISALVPFKGSEIYLDQKKFPQTATSSEVVLFDSLPVGKHNLLVGRDGYWPWTKTIVVRSASESEARPFNVPRNTSGVMIGKEDPEYWEIFNKVRYQSLPTPENRIVSADKTTAVWEENQTIYASYLSGKNRTPYYFCPAGECVDVLKVHQSKDSIRSLSFYPERPDVLIASASNAVFAIEIDATGTQNFQPIYKGNEPYFIVSERGTLYIEDGGHLFEVSL